jgi:hypothetical protein
VGRSDVWHERVFWLVWLITLAHAVWRSNALRDARTSKAWGEQCWAIAVLAVAAVVLNALTTGDNLFSTLSAAYWPVAGVDLMLCISAAVACASAVKIQRSTRQAADIALQSGEPVDA